MYIILLEYAFPTYCPEGITRMPEHIGRSTRKLVDLSERQMWTSKIPQVDGRMVTIIRGCKLGALVCPFLGTGGRSPARMMNRKGRVQDDDRFLPPDSYGEVPHFDASVEAGAQKVFAIWMPVDGGTCLLVGGDLLFGRPIVAIVPAHYGAIVGAEGELDGVSG